MPVKFPLDLELRRDLLLEFRALLLSLRNKSPPKIVFPRYSAIYKNNNN